MHACAGRVAQPLLDVAFAGGVAWLAIDFGAHLQALFVHSLWATSVLVGTIVPAISIALIKFTLYVAPLWRKQTRTDPFWNGRVRWLPLGFALCQGAVLGWLLTIGYASGNQDKHIELGGHAVAIAALAGVYVMLLACAVMSGIAHHRFATQSVFGDDDAETSFQTKFDALDASAAASVSEMRPANGFNRAAYSSALMRSEQSTEMAPLVEREPDDDASGERTEDEQSEELFDRDGADKSRKPATRLFSNGFSRRKGRPRRKGE